MDNLRIDMALTDLQLRNLKPNTQPYLLTDARGLALEVLSSGTASWRYRYQLNGKTEKVTLGRYPVVGLKDARVKRDELAAAVFRCYAISCVENGVEIRSSLQNDVHSSSERAGLMRCIDYFQGKSLRHGSK